MGSAGPDRPGGPRKTEPPPGPPSPERGGRTPAVHSPGRAGLSMPVRRRPRVLLPSARGGATRSSAGTGRGGGEHSPMVAMAAAAARARVSPPQPELHAGGPGGGDGSGPGSARGARAALGAPAASPGSGSGSARGRALWHGQGGPLHPRRSSARPSPASAAPLGPPARQSLSPAVAPSGHLLHLRNAPKNKPLVAQLAP